MLINQMKQHIITALIQLIVIVLYAISVFYLFKVEAVVLNPIPYLVGTGLAMIIIDTLVLLRISKERQLISPVSAVSEIAVSAEDNDEADEHKASYTNDDNAEVKEN
ncbi:MAG: hypothetical protein PHZ11_04320 [Desulfitobacteriaceae bacterium]|nr:hypothetical protein [Desulfitobacteriaceae bacterium]MDD4346115.1 hypothetical protein [Desulfitobacteriaceae bacterium]MDD4401075.1 hypothetical protein [Desulfitobacteriaceae bacterium]